MGCAFVPSESLPRRARFRRGEAGAVASWLDAAPSERHLPAPRGFPSGRMQSTSPSWKRLFPEASDAQWRDWRWQLRHSVRTLEDLERLVPLTEDERRG